MTRTLTVEAACGRIAGRDEGGVGAFRGIPYGEPPTGAGAQAAPVPRAPFAGTFEAFRYGLSAPQHATLPKPLRRLAGTLGYTGDDCLNLNVWTPDVAGRAPVMVFVHGGAFILGSGAQYPGADLARRGIVVVTPNYRLGLSGFNALAELRPGDDRFVANAGLCDQRLALKWVRDNIAAFGGDPERVTLAGESAGAISVAHHLVAPASRGLFQAAILQSGTLNLCHARERAVTLTERALALAGASARDPSALLRLDARALARLGMRLSRDNRTIAPRPYFTPGESDGCGLPDLYGVGAPVPLMIGTNRDEFSLFSDVPIVGLPSDQAALEEWLRAVAPADAVARIAALYCDDHAGRVRLGTDLMFRMSAIHHADRHASRAPVFMYRLDWRAKGAMAKLGATHSVDLPLLFDDFLKPMRGLYLGLRPDPARRALGKRMRDRWVAFVRDHRPGAGWPAYDTPRRATMILNERDAVADDPEGDRRRVWGEADGFAP